MPRQLRVQAPDTIFHVTSRGNAQQDIYTCDDERVLFLNLLTRVVSEREWLCHAYCLMNNHFHLVVGLTKPNLSEGMKDLNHRYALLFNRFHQRSGHLFQSRFYSKIVPNDEYMMETSRYVELNPLRAGLTRNPESWPWSSYGELFSEKGIASHELVLSIFSDNHASAYAQYLDFLKKGMDEAFCWQDVREYLNGNRKAPRPSLADVFEEVEGRERRMAEAYNVYGYKLREIAEFLGLSTTYVHRMIRRESGLVEKTG